MKTIRCPRATGQKWLEDLRSGRYEQGGRQLASGCGQYCCLGVLQMGASGCVENDVFGQAGQLPSKEWLVDNGITFLSYGGGESRTPFLPKFGTTADDANDSGHDFFEIADAIEDTIEYTD